MNNHSKNPQWIKNKFYNSSIFSIDHDNYKADSEERWAMMLDHFFWNSFRMIKFCNIEGDYLEFGVGGGVRSFRLALKYKILEELDMKLYGFDSFQGLPEPKGIDTKNNIWQKGMLSVSLAEFQHVMETMNASLENKDYRIVDGFYNETLDNHSPIEYGIQKAAMVFVDCDLYESTKSVLKFVKDILIDGSILAFDDWFFWGGNIQHGECRAFHEFLQENENIVATEHMSIGWHGKSFIIHFKE